MKNLSLYQLNEQILELVVEIEAAETAGDTELIAELEETITQTFTAIDAKRERYCEVIRTADAQSKALREEARRFSARAKNMDALSKRLKLSLQEDLEKFGEVRAEAGKFQLAITNSPQRVVLEIPVEMLPSRFQDVLVKMDTTALRKALQDGESVEGASLEQGTHLRIR